jgi:hypothetical protein
MSLGLRRGNFVTLPLKQVWLYIAAIAFIPLLAGASAAIETTIPESAAPITIDRCVVTLQKTPAGQALLASVDFTNVSQRAATEVRFALRIVDAIGRTEGTLTDDKVGAFAPGIAISHSTAAPMASETPLINAIPASAKIVCTVQMVRFDDGSVWNDGDGPVGSGVVVTPPPQPAATPPWQWPFDPPSPP